MVKIDEKMDKCMKFDEWWDDSLYRIGYVMGAGSEPSEEFKAGFRGAFIAGWEEKEKLDRCKST